jgi:predicted N-acyltransferase
MFKPFSFAESIFWKEMVQKTYPLKVKSISVQDNNINLFDNGTYLSNSPYITDGGVFNFEKPLSKSDFKDIEKPILLKSRSEIKVDSSFQHILVKDYFTFLLDLSKGEDDVWKNKIKSKTRNQVRKGEKTDFVVKFGKTELLDDFYKVISTAWRDLGTPTHGKSFYGNIVTAFPENSGYGSCFCVIYVQNKPVSAACLIYDQNSLHHPYAATLKEYNHLSMNNVLYWNIMKFAISKNIHYFDLGRSRKDQSTVPFKQSWGAEPVQLYYYYFNKTEHTNDEDNKVTKFLIQCWKKLPVSVANFLGPKVIFKVMK